VRRGGEREGKGEKGREEREKEREKRTYNNANNPKHVTNIHPTFTIALTEKNSMVCLSLKSWRVRRW